MRDLQARRPGSSAGKLAHGEHQARSMVGWQFVATNGGRISNLLGIGERTAWVTFADTPSQSNGLGLRRAKRCVCG